MHINVLLIKILKQFIFLTSRLRVIINFLKKLTSKEGELSPRELENVLQNFMIRARILSNYNDHVLQNFMIRATILSNYNDRFSKTL
jgi:hypothetical protein